MLVISSNKPFFVRGLSSIVRQFVPLLALFMIATMPLANAQQAPITSPQSSDPVDTIANQLTLAIKLRKSGQHDDAIALLEQIEQQGEHKRITFELAINYFKTQQYELSQQKLTQLSDTELSLAEQSKLASLQALVNKTKRQTSTTAHQFNANIFLYYGLDQISSTQYQADDFIDEYFDDEIGEYVYDFYSFTVPTEQKITRQRHYQGQKFALDYQFSPHWQFSLFSRNNKLSWLNQLNYYRRASDHQASQDYGKLNWRTRLLLSQQQQANAAWSWGIALKGSQHFRGSTKSLTEHSLESYLNWPLTKGSLKLGYELKYRRFSGHYDEFGFDQNAFQNENLTSPYLEYAYPFNQQWQLMIGVKLQDVNAVDPDASNHNRYFYSQLNYQLNAQFRTSITTNVNQLIYDNSDPDYYWWSKERSRSLVFNGHYQMRSGLMFGLNWSYFYRDTDHPLIDDKWQRIEGYIGYRF